MKKLMESIEIGALTLKSKLTEIASCSKRIWILVLLVGFHVQIALHEEKLHQFWWKQVMVVEIAFGDEEAVGFNGASDRS